MRIDKFLSSQSNASRGEIKKLLKENKVYVNGTLVKNFDAKVNENTDIIILNGIQIEYKKFVYIMMNKPSGVLSATEDEKTDTVIDLLPKELYRKELFPAGRLDKDTEGLIILTNDGDFAHRMLSPKKKIYKQYFAKLDGKVTQETVKKFEEGIIFKDGTECRPAKLKIAEEIDSAYVKICEGKFHQVKKMFLACGLRVKYLKRISIGELFLDENLKLGEAKFLDEVEINKIFVQYI